MKPHRATLVLVFGILSLVVCAPLGILAWIFGQGDLREMDQGLMDPTGREMTNTGRILGIVGTVLFGLTILGIVAYLAFIGVFLGAAAASGAAHP